MQATVLIADDDPDILDLISALLTQEGFQTVLCSNGLVALQRIQAQRPALAIVDLFMPVMSGRELIQHVRDAPGSHLPILLMSASSSLPPSDLLQADAYLAEPFDLEELLEYVTLFTSQSDNEVCPKMAEPVSFLSTRQQRDDANSGT